MWEDAFEKTEIFGHATPQALDGLARPTASPNRRISVDQDQVAKGLGQLVLTLVRLLHELLERQAIRRMEGGALTDAQIEELGSVLLRQSEEIERLAKAFGLKTEELNLDLGPLGRLL